jgi:hypothetical protein
MEHPGGNFHVNFGIATEKGPALLRRPGFRSAA